MPKGEITDIGTTKGGLLVASPRLTPGVFSSAISRWETPAWVIQGVERRYGSLSLDVAASATNAKAPMFFTEETNGLDKRWSEGWWMNPPYDNVKKFAYKARDEAYSGLRGTALVPARTDTIWWHDGLLRAAEEITFLKGRIRFELDGAPGGSAPFPSAVVRLGPDGGQPRVNWMSRQQWEIGWLV